MIAFAPLAHIQPQSIVKICGLRSIEHAIAAADSGAALLGLVFAPSKRRVESDDAAALVAGLRRTGRLTAAVGVFVNEEPAAINAIAERCGLAAVQLSGDEPPTIVDLLEWPVIAAIRLRSDERERGWIELARRCPERVLLLVDAHLPGSYGGAGVVADWKGAAALARELPLLLAGGLSPENVAEAVTTVQPLGVDVSSGVETKGVKDPEKIRAFLEAVRAVAGTRRGGSSVVAFHQGGTRS
ncbi:MAG: N-(5'-phosphoribosyl)anthranilate isomerase [Herpetosiphonaceae bacterium]|nr:MAG: N-(5'-phosphoribosyl)anthranilate isomerase [Herpetosiphonaceae bacterium]